MKILILHNQLWSQYKSIIFEKINNYCLKNGDELLVLQTSICENSRKELIDFDVDKFNYKYKFILLNHTDLESTNSFITTFKWIKNILIFKPSVINLTGYSEIGTILILLISKLLNIKTVITNESIYNYRFSSNFIPSQIKKLYKVIIFNLTDYFFSYGINSNDFLFRHKVKKGKILSFFNAFDSERFDNSRNNYLNNISNNDFFFLFVGRISFEKNLDYLIELAIFLKNKNSNIKIKIIGNGPDIDNLKAKIQLFKLNNIQLLGSIKWDKLGEFYSKSLALILPSYFEPWGMVANEAFFCKTPVICSSFCGCADDLVINNFNGIVIPYSSLFEKAKDFNLLIDNVYELREKFTQNIELTNRIFDVNRLSSELYLSFKRSIC